MAVLLAKPIYSINTSINVIKKKIVVVKFTFTIPSKTMFLQSKNL